MMFAMNLSFKNMRLFLSLPVIAGSISVALLSGCVSFPATIAAELELPKSGQPNPYDTNKETLELSEKTRKAVKSAKEHPAPDAGTLPLRSGQLVVVDDMQGLGLYTGLFADAYVPWTHIGVLSIEAGELLVYETTATLIPLPSFRPNSLFFGKARRVPLEQFWKGKIAGIYDLPPEVDAAKVVAYMRHHHDRGTPFDPYFDIEDATALYCSELVALALVAGGAKPIQGRAMRENRSYTPMREWLNMRSSRIIMPGQLIDPKLLVARWSEGMSPAQIDAHFELRRELFARFDADVSVGSLLQFTDLEFAMRENVRVLTAEIFAVFADFDGDLASIRQEVARRAQAFFVPSSQQEKTKPSAK
jgi:hypothetical protein